MRRDELLAQAVAANQRRIAATGKDQAIVRPKQKRLRDAAQCAEAGDQGVLQCATGSCGLAAARQVPVKCQVSTPSQGYSSPGAGAQEERLLSHRSLALLRHATRDTLDRADVARPVGAGCTSQVRPECSACQRS